MGNSRRASGWWVWALAVLGSVLSVSASAADNLPVRDAWLRDYLPDDTLLYARIPHPFGMLAAPKGNAFDAALRNDANMTMVARIREGISENVLPRIPMFEDARLRLLEKLCSSRINQCPFKIYDFISIISDSLKSHDTALRTVEPPLQDSFGFFAFCYI